MAESGTASPQEFGKYLLLERIAMGGMAEIFRAKKLGAEGFEKELVIKRVLPHYSEDESFITMFKDEARIAANLNHSNICQVYEFDELDGSFYIAMEYIPGRDLKRATEVGQDRDFPMTVAQVAWMGAQVAAALHYAHTKEYNGAPLNIVHRDVTPHNIMLSFGGDVKLMDFGIAKAAARSTRTQAGTVKGKCAYMSPEQARGKDLDGRSDVFALGIVMWETLARRRLFLGDSEFETLSNVLKKPVPSLSSLDGRVPPRLQAIIEKALARDRDVRHKDAAVLERDLMSYFYQECDPSRVQLDAYMRYLFDGGPRPDLGEEPPPGSAEEGIAETQGMPSIRREDPGSAGDLAAMAARAVRAAATMSRSGARGTGSVAEPAGPPEEPTALTNPQKDVAPLPPAPDEAPARPAGRRDQATPPATAPMLVPQPFAADADGRQTTPMRAVGAKNRSASASQQMAEVDATPGLTAYTGQVGARRGMGSRLLVAGAALAVVGLVGWVVLSGGEKKGGAVEGAPDAAAAHKSDGAAADKNPPVAAVAEAGGFRDLRIESEPPGATVYLDDDLDLPQTTPFRAKRKIGGTLKVRARLARYKQFRMKADIQAGEGPQAIVLKLEPE